MSDQHDSNQSKNHTTGKILARFRWFFKKTKRELEADPSKANNAGAQEDPLVRETRRLAAVTRQMVIWTRVIAGIAILAFFAALLQWDAMRGQLAEMKSAGVDTKNAVDATNRLATAARDQADTALDMEHSQLRAYVGPVFGSFYVLCPDCPGFNQPAAIPDAPDFRNGIVYKIRNYGVTPAYTPIICAGGVPVGPNESFVATEKLVSSTARVTLSALQYGLAKSAKEPRQ